MPDAPHIIRATHYINNLWLIQPTQCECLPCHAATKIVNGLRAKIRHRTGKTIITTANYHAAVFRLQQAGSPVHIQLDRGTT